MKQLFSELWTDCFGNKHVVDEDIYNALSLVGSWVVYNKYTSGYLEGIFYDDFDFYYCISDLNNKIQYHKCSCGNLQN